MHIALEGIRGAGKSTIISRVLPEARLIIPDLNFMPITAPMCTLHPFEKLIKEKPSLQNDDRYIEQLFLERAIWHQSQLINRSKFILGDRSIATAFVTRWNKWKDPYYTISKVKEQYKDIQRPDVIIWLKSDLNKALENIKSRVQKEICQKDERSESLVEANNIYEELFSGRVYHRKVNSIQVVEVQNCTSTDVVSSEVLSIIKFYSKS